jgi:hypothetical protein
MDASTAALAPSWTVTLENLLRPLLYAPGFVMPGLLALGPPPPSVPGKQENNQTMPRWGAVFVSLSRPG